MASMHASETAWASTSHWFTVSNYMYN